MCNLDTLDVPYTAQGRFLAQAIQCPILCAMALTHRLRVKQPLDLRGRQQKSLAALSGWRARCPKGTSRSALWRQLRKHTALPAEVPEPLLAALLPHQAPALDKERTFSWPCGRPPNIIMRRITWQAAASPDLGRGSTGRVVKATDVLSKELCFEA